MKKCLYPLLILVAACGGGSKPQPPPPAAESPGGIWAGTRPNGTLVTAFISETGTFRIFDEFGNQGAGNLVVSNVNQFSVSYTFVPLPGESLIDGSVSAECSANGTLSERSTIDYNVSCVTSLGMDLGGTFPFAYSGLYDRASSLAIVAGQYDNDGQVLTIDAAGVLFEQNAENGCVVNGNIRPIDTRWNLYEGSFTIDSCLAEFTALNGVLWEGLAALVTDEFGNEYLAGAYTGIVDGSIRSIVIATQRI